MLNQKRAYEHLKKYKVGALFMEMGTGKTKTAFDLIKSRPIKKVAFVIPKSLFKNFENELTKWNFNINYKLFSLEGLGMSDRIYFELINYLTKETFLLVDESLKIKNSKAKRTKRLIEIGKKCEYKLILNGTPVSKNILDLWSQFEFLSPKILRMNENQFYNSFCEYGKKGNKQWIIGYHNLKYLYKKIEPFIFESNFELDKKKIYKNINYFLQNDKEYIEIKEEKLKNIIKYGDKLDFIKFACLLQMSISFDKNKIAALDELIKSLKGKIIIYAKFINEQCFLKERYKDCLILGYGNSFGLNLQEYNYTIYFSKTWDYALRIQSEARTYRYGQNNNCYYYDFTSNAGIDKLINDNINKKDTTLNNFNKMTQKEREKWLKYI